MRVKAIVTLETSETDINEVKDYIQDAIATHIGCYSDLSDDESTVGNVKVESVADLGPSIVTDNHYTYSLSRQIVTVMYQSDRSVLIRFKDDSEKLITLDDAYKHLSEIEAYEGKPSCGVIND